MLLYNNTKMLNSKIDELSNNLYSLSKKLGFNNQENEHLRFQSFELENGIIKKVTHLLSFTNKEYFFSILIIASNMLLPMEFTFTGSKNLDIKKIYSGKKSIDNNTYTKIEKNISILNEYILQEISKIDTQQ